MFLRANNDANNEEHSKEEVEPSECLDLPREPFARGGPEEHRMRAPGEPSREERE